MLSSPWLATAASRVAVFALRNGAVAASLSSSVRGGAAAVLSRSSPARDGAVAAALDSSMRSGAVAMTAPRHRLRPRLAKMVSRCCRRLRAAGTWWSKGEWYGAQSAHRGCAAFGEVCRSHRLAMTYFIEDLPQDRGKPSTQYVIERPRGGVGCSAPRLWELRHTGWNVLGARYDALHGWFTTRL